MNKTHKIFHPKVAAARRDNHKWVWFKCIRPANRHSDYLILLIIKLNAFVAPASPVINKAVLLAILRMKRVGNGYLLL